MSRVAYRRNLGRERKEAREDKPCEECGNPFTPKRSDARYCSRICGKRAYYRENKERMDEWHKRWAQEHPEETREIQRRSNEKHGAKYRQRKQERYDAIKADPELEAERKARRRQYYLENREAALEYTRRWNARDPFGSRRSKHGTDWLELFRALWDAQQGLCYLCGDPLQVEAYRAIHLDHDHSCCPLGRSCAICRRGLACKMCNVLIGHASDDPERLRRIADNLEIANAAVRERMAEAPPPALPFPTRTPAA